ncbi:hypothetical protein DBV14_14770 [Variovorax sp. KBW07]|uniref:hypothetical protein n=1 Tax=Variovorax sp. KBW07 TaxID=2153358 RepID=UPI000F58B9CD|nr:hypothetical protein [Variovorax sp. KBW07]RQO53293.1 hypothetical protein DBV14_14770 [Variovorax sp. KBW07]
MASYKHDEFLTKNLHAEFDKSYAPGTEAANAGIYRCTGCGDEIGIAKGHKLPPQNERQHPQRCGGIRWQLAVFAIQVKN